MEHDSRQVGALSQCEIEITREMIERGMDVIDQWASSFGVADVPVPQILVEQIVRAVLCPNHSIFLIEI